MKKERALDGSILKLAGRNPAGCVCFLALALMGALIGRALYRGLYLEALDALLGGMHEMAAPRLNAAGALLYGAVPPLAYAACMLLSGYRRWTLPLWGLAVLTQGALWGIGLGLCSTLIAAGYTRLGVAAISIHALLLPAYGLMALLPLEKLRRKARPLDWDDVQSDVVAYLVPAAGAVIGGTLLASVTSVCALRLLFR